MEMENWCGFEIQSFLLYHVTQYCGKGRSEAGSRGEEGIQTGNKGRGGENGEEGRISDQNL
jgi:hypothetical protein